MATRMQIVLDHVRADGPVSFESICHEVNTQCDEVEGYQVAEILNGLLRVGKIELYDDGKTFIPCK